MFTTRPGTTSPIQYLCEILVNNKGIEKLQLNSTGLGDEVSLCLYCQNGRRLHLQRKTSYVKQDEQALRICTGSSGLDECDTLNGRPASPGTMALLCYEQEAVLMEEGSRELIVDSQNKAPETSCKQQITESFIEQERVVLTRFRDFLKRLITCGSIKEMKQEVKDNP
ncbi:protein tesmin/TSO1-like CXC 6 isoform X2 [Beta vulgaris subsp. vulgaris]|uniref:protein tesmin/TSO1-like CXC 6 isoform X2 n=1 Tax=Beta vulgaris subsp. vulgaris TaxID=3555 RepID=UPI0020372F21|nr:protein tesmin/TSO1-like CXC 6 isoform X2 [Beta vulgaris subsp. vulgaris]